MTVSRGRCERWDGAIPMPIMAMMVADAIEMHAVLAYQQTSSW